MNPASEGARPHSATASGRHHPARDAILRELAARDILVNVSYRWPIHTMPAYAHADYPEGSLPETEQAAREIFSLPMYPSLTDAEQDRVCEALREILPP